MSLVGIVRVSTASLVLLQQASAASLCMDVPATGEGVNVQVWGCNGLPQQQWDASYIPLSLFNSPSLCLDETIDTTNGNLVTTGTCMDVDKNPAWHLVPDSGEIQFGSSGKCLDAGDMQEGTQLMIWDCNGLSQQKWGYDSDMKTIYLADSRRLQSEEDNSSTSPVGGEDRFPSGSNSTLASIGKNSTRSRLRGASTLVADTTALMRADQSALSHYVANPKRNCYAGHGGVGPVDGQGVSSAEACAQVCDADATCQAFVWREVTQTCWPRSAVDLPNCEVNAWIHKSDEYTTYTKQAEQCVQEGQTCGGPGLSYSTCCAGMQCERQFMGTHNLQCVVKKAQCVSSGQSCGCAGCLTQTCCDGQKCSEVSGQGGKLFCVDI